MRMPVFVMIFMGIWLVIPGLISFGVILVALNAMLQLKFHLLKFPMLIPIGFFLIGYLLMFFAFTKEAKKSREDLDALLQAEQSV